MTSAYHCGNCPHATKLCLQSPGNPYVFACALQGGKWMPSEEEGGWTFTLGCLSHPLAQAALRAEVHLCHCYMKEYSGACSSKYNPEAGVGYNCPVGGNYCNCPLIIGKGARQERERVLVEAIDRTVWLDGHSTDKGKPLVALRDVQEMLDTLRSEAKKP